MALRKLSPTIWIWKILHPQGVITPYSLYDNPLQFDKMVVSNHAKDWSKTLPHWIHNKYLHCRNTWLGTCKIVARLFGQNLCFNTREVSCVALLIFESTHSQYGINRLYGPCTTAVYSSSHNSSQYLINLETPLTISSSFFIGFALLGFGSPSGNTALLFSFVFQIKIPSGGLQLRVVQRGLYRIARKPLSHIYNRKCWGLVHPTRQSFPSTI